MRDGGGNQGARGIDRWKGVEQGSGRDWGRCPSETLENQPGWEGGKRRLLVGWGDTVWVMNIYSGNGGRDESRKWGWGEIVNK